MQSSASAAYWRDNDSVEPWANQMNGDRTAAGVQIGHSLYLQHDDPKQLRRLAEALNQAAFDLDILQARLAKNGSDAPAAVAS